MIKDRLQPTVDSLLGRIPPGKITSDRVLVIIQREEERLRRKKRSEQVVVTTGDVASKLGWTPLILGESVYETFPQVAQAVEESLFELQRQGVLEAHYVEPEGSDPADGERLCFHLVASIDIPTH